MIDCKITDFNLEKKNLILPILYFIDSECDRWKLHVQISYFSWPFRQLY